MRAFLLSIILCAFSTLSAQQKIAERVVGWNEDHIELHTIFDKSGQPVSFVLMSFDSIKAFVLDGSIQHTIPFNLKRNNSESFLGGFYRDNCIFLFFYDKQEDRLHNPVLNLENREVEQYFMPSMLGKEKIIDVISCGDHFLFFTTERKTAVCKLYDFYNESQYALTTHPIAPDLWNELLSGQTIARSAELEKAGFGGYGSLDIAASRIKVYRSLDTISLLVNTVKGRSSIYNFNLKAHTLKPSVINHLDRKTDSIVSKRYYDNACIVGDKLYYLFTTPDTLGIQVVNIKDHTLEKCFVVNKANDIDFKNTVIVETGGGTILYGNKPVVLTKTTQLIRKIMNTDALILAAGNNHQQIEIYIGSYEIRPGGRVAVQGMSSGFVVNAWSKSTGFKMLVDPRTADHITGEVRQALSERVDVYSDKLDISPKSKNLFSYQDTNFYVYYDRKARKICLVKFD